MIPISLRIKGFFSYKEEQYLDFQALTKAGLFGILGPTGAGKSSLVEAMLIALYGDSARCERSPRSLLHRGSKNGKIELTFEVGGEVYKALYEVQGTKVLHQLLNEAGEVMAGTGTDEGFEEKVQELLGLGYDNFTLAFVLQQGEFQRFLEIGAAKRTEILQALLCPTLPDLYGSTSTLLSETKGQLMRMEEEVKILAEKTSIAKENELKIGINNIQAQLNALQTQEQSLTQEIERLNRLAEKWKELQNCINELRNLEKEEQRYCEEKEKIRQIRWVHQELAALYGQMMRIEEEKKRAEEDLRQAEAQLKQDQREAENLRSRVQNLSKEWEKKSEYEQMLSDLRKIEPYNQIRADVKNLEEGIEKVKKDIERKQKELKEQKERDKALSEAIRKWDEELKSLPQELLDWYRERMHKQEEIEKAEQKASRTQEELRKLQEAYENELEKAKRGLLEAEVPFIEQIAKDKYPQVLNDLIQTIEEKVRALELSDLAARLAERLKEGHPCPVCGSTSHPEPAHPSPDYANMQRLQEQLQTLRSFNSDNQAKFAAALSLHREANKDLEEKKKKLQEHDNTFAWYGLGHRPTLAKKEIEALKQKRSNLEMERDKAYDDKDDLQIEMHKIQKALDEYREYLDKLQVQKAQKEGQLTQLQNSLKPEWLQASEKEVGEQINKLQKKLDEIKDYPTLSGNLKQKEVTINSTQNNTDRLKKQIQSYEEEYDNQRKLIEQKSNAQGLTWEKIEEYIKSNRNLETEEDKVNEYLRKLDHLRRREQELSAEAQGYDPRVHQEVENELGACRQQKERLKEQKGSLMHQLTTLYNERKRLSQLQNALASLRVRQGGLEKLKNLFHSKGFAQYILSTTFTSLIAQANQYLRRWCGGTLELAPSADEISVEVKDHLIQGAPVRSVRTLSGGQTFLTSLALALALSDRVRRYSPKLYREKGFFFIDEGFGTLDAQTLDEVMKTLRDLSREGRVIGIITHREEVQQQLGAFVQVRLQKGTSRVHPLGQKE